MTTVRFALRNTIDYHVDKGAALCRQSNHVKNHDQYEKMMKAAGHHFSVADDCRRRLWMDERRRK